MTIAIYDSDSQCRERLKDVISAALLISDIEPTFSEIETPTDLLKTIADCDNLDFVVYSAKDSEANDSALRLAEEKSVCLTLVKPYTVKDVIYKLKTVINVSDNNKYTIALNRKLKVINKNDIMFIESNNTRCILHLNDGNSYVQYKQLDDIEKEIAEPNFLRCHKSFLVNMDYIESADKSFILTTGEEILIKQRELGAVKKKLLEYYKSPSADI